LCPIRDSGSTRAGIVTERSGLAATHADRGAATPEPLAPRGPELAVIVPTLNEQANVPLLIERLHHVLAGIAWEVVFVDDDSADGTAAVVRAIAQVDTRVRCVQRIGRRGLASACIEGVLATSAPILAVMDADLQHDETLLPTMLAAVRDEAIDVAIASRYVAGGSVGAWGGARARGSDLATRVSRLILRADIADPMSGFFVIRRDAFDAAVRKLSGQGFKILLDLLASSPRPLRAREFPYTFRPRQFGESKLDAMVVWEFFMLIADKLIGRAVPVRFALFALIGGFGVFVNLVVLRVAMLGGLRFAAAEALATVAAMVSNFLLNNQFTYRDRRLHGWRMVRGLAVFCLGCSVGAVANIGIAAEVFGEGSSWWLAGLSGALIGAVWNYAIASTYTWGRAR
jgi:dolichol-phosphate mannosyltransferase